MIAETILTVALRNIISKNLILEQVKDVVFPRPIPGRDYLLYVHVPFCEVLCPYCSFHRVRLEQGMARPYFEALERELRMIAKLGYNFRSMYIGGGTPTLFVHELNRLIDLARDLFDVREVSCESNPNHMTLEIADVLGDRVQRMSVGVQTFDDRTLHQLARFERFGSGEQILRQLHLVAGRYKTLNIDLIFNYPQQSEISLRRDIEMALASGADQITFYPLMTSPSVARTIQQAMGQVDYHREAQLYQIILDSVPPDYQLTTPWNFARKSGYMIDEYIVDEGDYIGAGSGAFSYLDGTLLVNSFSLADYQRSLTAGRFALRGRRTFNRLQQMRYRLMMDLFGLELDKQSFREKFGVSIEQGLPLEMAFLKSNGAFAIDDNQKLRLSRRGLYLLVIMMREFFSNINTIRDQARRQVATMNPEGEARSRTAELARGFYSSR
ncbi:MAG: coproporphyrinogen III oxidase family protein [Anaerolineales bacterium]